MSFLGLATMRDLTTSIQMVCQHPKIKERIDEYGYWYKPYKCAICCKILSASEAYVKGKILVKDNVETIIK